MVQNDVLLPFRLVTESQAMREVLGQVAKAAATPPQGMAMGKFQGDTTTTTPWGPVWSAGISCHQRAVSR